MSSPTIINNSLLDFLNVDDPSFSADASSTVSWSYSQLQSPVKIEDEGWSRLLLNSPGALAPATLSSMNDDDDSQSSLSSSTPVVCIGGLSQLMSSSSSRSPTPELYMPGALVQSPPAQPTAPTTIALNPSSFHTNPASRALSPPVIRTPLASSCSSTQKGKKATSTATTTTAQSSVQPHPYAISPHNTAALFTRASSVCSNSSSPAAKKSRAPPSGPISTRDFIPPDVSGLNKREARLVKNRAAAFLSRQRKREEFEGLEARVEVLEQDNARLYREIESYKSGSATPRPTGNAMPASAGALTAEIAGLKRQLASRDVELSNLHTRIRSLANVHEQLVTEKDVSAERQREISDLKVELASRGNVAMKEEDTDDSDSEDADSTVNSKKELKSAGSVAVMVLLFSLSTLLTNAKTGAGAPKPPTASDRVTRRPHMHHRSDSRLSVSSSSGLASYFDSSSGFASSSLYDSSNPFSIDSMLSGSSGSSFGFDEDSLMSGPSATLTSSSTPLTGLNQEQDALQRATASAISGVKSTGPDEFEFDFTIPTASSSTPLPSYFGTPTAAPEQQRKIKVCVKSAVPLDLDLGAALGGLKRDELVNGPTSFGSTLPSPVKFQPDDDLDAPSAPFDSSLGKRKRVMVEIKPRASLPNVRRKLVDDEERWDVSVREELMEAEEDEDVLMM